MNPRISIIIPTYNRSQYICKAVESVFNQTFSDCEVIVVDDGSTDDTKEILLKFAGLPNFKYFYQKNSGRSAARNKGIAKASGEYLLFLDSDDFLYSNALEMLINYTEKYPLSGVVGGEVTFINENGENKGSKLSVKIEDEILDKYIGWKTIRNLAFPIGSYLIKKPLALEIGGFQSAMEPSEDMDFSIKACLQEKITFFRKPVTFVLRHDHNTAEAPLRRAAIKIAQAGVSTIENNKSNFNGEIAKRIKYEWELKTAEDYYFIGENLNSLKHHLKALSIFPSTILQLPIIKQIVSCGIPFSLRKTIKNLINN